MLQGIPYFSKDTQLSLDVDHFISGLADSTTRDYLLHDRACRALSRQETVQMAQACEASRFSLHASLVAAAVAVRKSALYRLTSARAANPPIILLRLCGNRVHAMGV